MAAIVRSLVQSAVYMFHMLCGTKTKILIESGKVGDRARES